MKMKKIFAIVGMPGSGKSEAIDFLQKKFRWPKVYFGEITFDEMKKRKLDLTHDNERLVREQLRKKYGMGIYASRSMPKIRKALNQSPVVLIESLYSWSEYKIMKESYKDMFKVINVHASPDTRFGRLQKRTKWRPMKNYKEFKKRDWTEIEYIEKGGPIAVADYVIVNEGTKKDLENGIRKILVKEGLKIK